MWGVKEVVVSEWEAGLLYEDGRYVKTLGAGRHKLVGRPWARGKSVTRVDLRRQLLSVTGQELLTADGLAVRLNLTAEWRVVDPAVAVHGTENYLHVLYEAVQLALRHAVHTRTLETLLADRAALSEELKGALKSDADRLGVEVMRVGLKDIVLSGELKKLLAREAEILREGKAALAAAREEVAAARARANTAKLLAESPALMRLRELEAIEKVGSGAGNTVLVALPGESRVAVNV